MQQSHDFYAAHHVQKSGRLIQDDKRTFLNQCFGYHYLLPFSVRKFGGVAFGFVGNAYGIQCLFDNEMVFGMEPSEEACMRLAPQSYQFIHGQSSGLCLVCQDYTDGARTFLFRILLQRLAQQLQISCQ